MAATVDDHVLSFPYRNNEFLQPCNHEEADTRMFVHVNDAITQDNFRSVLIHLVDIDVVVVVNAAYGFNVEIFVAFRTGNSFRGIEAHQLAQKLGLEKCVAILLFHSFTGYDSTSFFSCRSKMSAWTVWDLFDDVTRVFCALPMHPENIHTEMPVLERLVVLLYHKTSSKLEVDESRFKLFSAMNRQIDNIPPTAASLVEHTKRAVLQANIWHLDRKETNELDPASFGWRVIEGK